MIENSLALNQPTVLSFTFIEEIKRENGEILVTSHPIHEDAFELKLEEIKRRGYRTRYIQRIKSEGPPVLRYGGDQLNAVLEPIENF